MNLDVRLEESSTFVTDLDLCQVRLSHNARFPWALLIPKAEGITEIIDMPPASQLRLMMEISLTSRIMRKLFSPDKLNVAALGNVVPQLHVHVIARYKDDEAWPNPVWNSGIESAYENGELEKRISLLQEAYAVYKVERA